MGLVSEMSFWPVLLEYRTGLAYGDVFVNITLLQEALLMQRKHASTLSVEIV